jgi:hypothetical protein
MVVNIVGQENLITGILRTMISLHQNSILKD